MAKYKVEAKGYKMDAAFRSSSLECAVDVYCKLKTKLQDYSDIALLDMETGEVYCSCTIDYNDNGYYMSEYVAHTILER